MCILKNPSSSVSEVPEKPFCECPEVHRGFCDIHKPKERLADGKVRRVYKRVYTNVPDEFFSCKDCKAAHDYQGYFEWVN